MSEPQFPARLMNFHFLSESHSSDCSLPTAASEALFTVPSAVVTRCPEMSAQSWLWSTLICDGCLSHNDALMSRRSKHPKKPARLRYHTNRSVPMVSAPPFASFSPPGNTEHSLVRRRFSGMALGTSVA